MTYEIEYAKSACASCKGPKNGCSEDRKIKKGELRLGTKVESNSFTSAGSADQIPGFNDLHDEDQERMKKVFEEGNISEKEGGKNDDDDDDESDKKKKPAVKKSKATAMESKKVGRPKKQKAEEEKAEGEGDANEAGPKMSNEDPAEEKPKKRVKK
ncbi:hypothetical protein BC936DRAFT_140641 [Jimgerdemannia flammicorona]|uniref:PARP-type domain-containing protein n=1 Tax=Jimgerdemannia flammicorona TaxID=994334 RepID=A0A433AHR4_9FUNG|nr:hypothetical protein BC936DRAFT_140641 [Jimgerdemannia flammicorona]